MENSHSKLISIFFISALAFVSYRSQAQIYRTANTQVLENNGNSWIEKKLPASIITYSDYSGQVKIKTLVSSLTGQGEDSALAIPAGSSNDADFIMNLDKSQLPEQITAAKTNTTAGTLTINNITKTITAQYVLAPRNSGDGFGISVIMRFNPADFNIKIKDEPASEPLIVKVSGGYLNKQVNNF